MYEVFAVSDFKLPFGFAEFALGLQVSPGLGRLF